MNRSIIILIFLLLSHFSFSQSYLPVDKGTEIAFNINFNDPCIANRTIHNKQNKVTWHISIKK